MPEAESLGPLQRAAQDAQAWLDACAIPAAVIGGLVSAKKWGIEPRISDAPEFARANDVLLLRHAATGVSIDISLGMLPFELEAVERARNVEFATRPLRIACVEDLIVMKLVAGRSQDWTDIDLLIAACEQLDEQRILEWSTAFCTMLEIPERLEELRRRLSKRRAP